MARGHARRVAVEVSEILAGEGRGRADDEAVKPDRFSLFDRAEMGADRILDIQAAIGQFIDLHIVLIEGVANIAVIIVFRKKARGAQHQGGQAI